MTEQEIFIQLFEPMHRMMNDKQWEWFLQRGVRYTQEVTEGKLTPSLVKKMRDAQKYYFKTGAGLKDCKGLESRVDAILALLPDIPVIEQAQLFDR